jgi:propionyl-CoA carboxylase alpha chain
MVRRIMVVPGQRVAAGDLLLVLDALTLEHPIHAPGDGVVADLPVPAGTQVQTGTVVAVISADFNG